MIALAALFGYLLLPRQAIVPQLGPASASTTDAVQLVPAEPLGPAYTNSTFRFSLRMPADFRASELPPDDSGAHTILLQNGAGQGIQILVTPYQSDPHVITADDVRASIPDMKVAEEQPVQIGSDYTGVAFRSDNDAFGGDSREVWFVFRKNLYQISTYGRLDPLLKEMFATWQFF